MVNHGFAQVVAQDLQPGRQILRHATGGHDLLDILGGFFHFIGNAPVGRRNAFQHAAGHRGGVAGRGDIHERRPRAAGPTGGPFAGQEGQHSRCRGRHGCRGNVIQAGAVQTKGALEPADGTAHVIEGTTQQASRRVDPVAPQSRRNVVRPVMQEHSHGPGGGSGDDHGLFIVSAHTDIGAQPVGHRGVPLGFGQALPAGGSFGVHIG